MHNQLTAGLLFASVAVACGGADPSDLLTPSDASTATDGGPADSSPTPPVVCPTDAGNCSDPDVPSGWAPVAYTSDRSTPCPTHYDSPEDVGVDPTLGANGCSCSCTKTKDPDCQTGVSYISGIGQTCNGSNVVGLFYSGGTCLPTGGTVDDYDEATTIKPTGGACTVQTVSNNTAVTTTPGRLCTPDGTCHAAACGGYAPNGFSACIVTDGDVACPAASVFSEKHVVAQQASAQCSSCSSWCTFQGTCSSPQLAFYSNNTCTQLIVSIPANATCTQTNKANAVIGGTKYTATANFTGCTASGTSTGTLQLQSPRTFCCRP